MPEQIWFKNPTVLFDKDTWTKFVPTKDMTTGEALNAVLRFSVYFSLILFLATSVSGYIMAIPIMMVSTILLHNLFPNGKTIESFVAKAQANVGPEYTRPSKENPFMNVLLTEIQDNPDREDAAPTNRRDVKADIYKSFQATSDIYMDTTDLFDQAQAMRTFHTMQSARVPNDLEGFKKWLAKDLDAPDYSSAPPARHGKALHEGYVAAKGSIRGLPNSTDKKPGTTPTGPLPAKRVAK
jgi:hypothetical protein